MKIAIDVNSPAGFAAGLEIWVRGFIEGLSMVDVENEYLIFGFFMRNFEERKKSLLVPEGKHFHLYVKRVPRPLILFLEDNNIPVIEHWLKNRGVNIFHGTGYFLPCLKKIKGITTIHGLDFIEMDAYWYRDKWYKNVGRYIKRADIVIAVSEYVKRKIVEYYGIEEERVKVVYPGVDRRFKVFSVEFNVDKSRRSGFSSPYIFTVATSFKRKNLKRLVNAFAILIGSEKDLLLVVAGSSDIEQPLLNESKRYGIEKNVHFAGYCDPESLAYLYNNAELFVFPSLYEGFGLPVIEAMACGCPVITSNVSALPEVSGDAALLVDPYDVEQLAETMKKVLKAVFQEPSEHKNLK